MRLERKMYQRVEPRKSLFEERIEAAYKAATKSIERESGPLVRTHKKPNSVRRKESSLARAKRVFEKKHSHMTRSELAHNPRTAWIYKQFWRHGLLHLVAHNQENEGALWAGNAWDYYVSDHFGESRGEINNFSNAFYKALRRQVLPKGFVLPDGTVLKKSCYAIDAVPVKRKRKNP